MSNSGEDEGDTRASVVSRIDREIAAAYNSRMFTNTEVRGALRRYWGYDSFRPLQEKIIRSLLDGHDTCVVMPTGGGKSVCYQLPAALVPQKTVVVISPLIALMHDQVAQLTQMGIPAAVLNSTLEAKQKTAVARKASEGAYRLLYLSPEKLASPNAISWLRSVPVAFFAIDEAHCISEWGHEFRPEYRRLNCLRSHFPKLPIAAFTASATQRVRHDIVEQLKMRDAQKYIASFFRPNLRYFARECAKGTQPGLLVKALRSYEGSNVIVYAPTIARVEETVDYLQEKGIAAIAYHGKMNPAARRRNQEQWMSDEVRVMVGTIAFGLGINKAAVRAVIHLALPKSLEQYYQEAGRAGRDGQPADCVLLWQKKDAGLLAHFAQQFTDPEEKERAFRRYYDIRDFAESKHCRHKQVCAHFGETVKWKSCGACNACGCTLEWLAAPVVAAKPPALKPAAQRKPVAAAGKGSAADVNADLMDYLREWRRETAKEQGVAAFVVMHDTTMDELCRKRPRTVAELRQVPGFGERKAERYGKEILDALGRFEKGERAKVVNDKKVNPTEETLRLLSEGRTFAEIAQIRGRQISSVVSLVAKLIEQKELDLRAEWVSVERQKQIEAACASLGTALFSPLKAALPPEVTYDEIRLVVARLRSEPQKRMAAAAGQGGGR
jgi:ATP-dependent DNA helicase RecQ